MARIDGWLPPVRVADWWGTKGRAAAVGNLIADKPISIEVRRVVSGGTTTTLSAQTVRIDTMRGAGEDSAMGDMALVKSQDFVILGYKNHPTIADTNLQSGDVFMYGGNSIRVKKVEPGFTDRLLAFAEAIE